MRILFSWYDFLMREWFIDIIKQYLKETNDLRQVHHFHRNNLVGNEALIEIVWTNESRCRSLDYELFYRKADNIFYIIRNPIYAILNYFLCIHREEEQDYQFFNSFAKRHLIEYITHYKCHRKITKDIIIYEEIRDNFDYFVGIMEKIVDNINKNLLYEIYSKNRPILLDISKIDEKDIELIRKIWRKNKLEWYWK